MTAIWLSRDSVSLFAFYAPKGGWDRMDDHLLIVME